MTRLTVYALLCIVISWSAGVFAIAALFFSGPRVGGISAAVSAAACIGAHLIGTINREMRRQHNEMAWLQSKLGVQREIPAPGKKARSLTVIEGGKRPVWPNDAGAPE